MIDNILPKQSTNLTASKIDQQNIDISEPDILPVADPFYNPVQDLPKEELWKEVPTMF